MEQLKQESSKPLVTIQLMKKYISVMQSAYFFSLLFFSSSLLFILLHTIKPNFSAFPLFSLLKFSVDRNHMFLLCNGILVILVKSSSSSSHEGKMDKSIEEEVANDHQERVVVLGVSESTEVVSNKSQEMNHADHENVSHDEMRVFVSQEIKCADNDNVSQEMEILEFVDDHDEEYVHDQNGDDYYYDDHEEQEDDLAAEELNKRCEDFIRRMKQGIISESRVDHSLTRLS